MDPDRGFVKDDRINLEVHVIADAPHGVRWVGGNSHSDLENLSIQFNQCDNVCTIIAVLVYHSHCHYASNI
jgi:hypothetical protein